jgi:hypothetical protein
MANADSRKAEGKSGYQSLGNADMRALQSITSANFAGSPFAATGLDFATLSFLRMQDRSYTAQNVLNAANDAKALGFSPKDRAAMADHATIDRYDPKARATNKAMQDYQKAIEGDEELHELREKRHAAKSVEDRKALDAEIAERLKHHAEKSGLKDRLNDPKLLPKAAAAVKRRQDAIEAKVAVSHSPNVKSQGELTAGKAASPDRAKADLFKALTSP